jgi:voltage-gated potassium channel
VGMKKHAQADGAQVQVRVRTHGNPYNIFILVTTILSLAIMAALLLPVSEETRAALLMYDNIACLIFLGDFAYNWTGAQPKRAYFIKGRGWIDLLGSIPSFGLFQFTVLLRLFRLFRLARISRLLRGQKKKELIADIVQNRGQYALFVTLLLIFIVVTVASLLVLQFETEGGGNIDRAGDAIWWTLVTITTVGYGDFYPITPGGRTVGVFVMFSGIAIIGALASILSSILVSSSASAGTTEALEAHDASQAAAAAVAEPEAGTGAPSGPLIPQAAEASARVAAALKVHRGEAVIEDPASTTTTSTTSHELAGFKDEMASLRAEIAELRAHLADERAARGTSPVAGAAAEPPSP